MKALTLSVAAALLLGGTLQAQGLRRIGGAPRIEIGGGLMLLQPVGQFENFVDVGGGLQLFGRANLDRQGILSLRVDAGFSVYGRETVTRPLSQTIRRVTVDVTTTNSIVSLGIGPQITVGGPIRIYGFGTMGFSYFATTSSVRGTNDFEEFASSTNFDDFTFAMQSGGGVLLGVSGGAHPVSIDLGVNYVRNGETSYLREGGIFERSDGTVVINPIRSQTNMVVYRIGVSVGLR